jgi:hypothetical protein
MPVKVSLLMNNLNMDKPQDVEKYKQREEMFEPYLPDTLLLSPTIVEMVVDSTSNHSIFNNSVDF